MRLLIVGTLKGQLTTATKIAMDNGASVTHAEAIEQAMAVLRGGKGADLLMVDVALDIRDLVMRLEAEHIHVPIVACGIANDARAAVAAIHAGAKEYIPLPPDPELIAAVLAAVANDQPRPGLSRRGDGQGGQARAADRGLGRLGADHRRIRHRQGSAGALRPRPLEPRQAAVHLDQLRGDPGAPAGIRTVRPREGRLHRRDRAPHRQVRGGDRRHAAARRNLRDGRPAAGQAAARHPGARDRPRRRHQAGAGRHPHHRDLEPQPRRGRARRHIPRGPAVPPQRRQPEDPAAARAPGRHPRTGAALRQEIRRGQRRAAAPDLAGSAPGADLEPLAGQRARTGKHHAPRGADGAGRRDRRRRDPHAGRRPARPRQDRARRGARHLRRRTGDARAGRPHRRRCRARPDPGDAEALPRQPHPRRQHPRHLDPHAAQQAQRICRWRAADPAGRLGHAGLSAPGVGGVATIRFEATSLRIARRIRLAENMDGIAGLKIAPGERRIGIEREIGDRERADAVEGPDRKTLHRVQPMSAVFLFFKIKTPHLLVRGRRKMPPAGQRRQAAVSPNLHGQKSVTVALLNLLLLTFRLRTAVHKFRGVCTDTGQTIPGSAPRPSSSSTFPFRFRKATTTRAEALASPSMARCRPSSQASLTASRRHRAPGRVPTTLVVGVPLAIQPQTIQAVWSGVRGSTVIIDTPATLTAIMD